MSNLVSKLLFLFAVACLSLAATAEIVPLNDGNFEHLTQASTGATTGSWLVLFTYEGCSSCKDIEEAMGPLGNDSDIFDQGVVLATVDARANPEVVTRFDIVTMPTVVFIHKGAVYYAPLRKYESITPEVLKSFVLSDFASVEAEPIPMPPTIWDKLNDIYIQIQLSYKGKNGVKGYFIFGFTGLMGMTVFIYVLAWSTEGRKKKLIAAAAVTESKKNK